MYELNVFESRIRNQKTQSHNASRWDPLPSSPALIGDKVNETWRDATSTWTPFKWRVVFPTCRRPIECVLYLSEGFTLEYHPGNTAPEMFRMFVQMNLNRNLHTDFSDCRSPYTINTCLQSHFLTQCFFLKNLTVVAMTLITRKNRISRTFLRLECSVNVRIAPDEAHVIIAFRKQSFQLAFYLPRFNLYPSLNMVRHYCSALLTDSLHIFDLLLKSIEILYGLFKDYVCGLSRFKL